MDYKKRVSVAGVDERFKGKLSMVTVEHEHWCLQHRGQDCCCKPDIFFNCDGEIFEIDEKGNIEKKGMEQ